MYIYIFVSSKGMYICIRILFDILKKLFIYVQVFFNAIYKGLGNFPNSNVHGANMGPTWGRQNPGGSHVGPMNFAIWAMFATDASTRYKPCVYWCIRMFMKGTIS